MKSSGKECFFLVMFTDDVLGFYGLNFLHRIMLFIWTVRIFYSTLKHSSKLCFFCSFLTTFCPVFFHLLYTLYTHGDELSGKSFVKCDSHINKFKWVMSLEPVCWTFFRVWIFKEIWVCEFCVVKIRVSEERLILFAKAAAGN